MKIVDYDEVNPAGILHLNLLSLGYVLTPERVQIIRECDPRIFPFAGLYAVEDATVIGQVLVYRLPMISINGREDVGGVAAVCTHPAYSHQGIAAALMEAAHQRMRDSGLRFSTLGTARHRIAHLLYRRLGYVDVHGSVSLFATREVALRRRSRLYAERATQARLHLADTFFSQVASEYVGFAWRPNDFLACQSATGDLNPNDVWLIWKQDKLAGYAIALERETVLVVTDLLLSNDIVPPSAIAALIEHTAAAYIQVTLKHHRWIEALRAVGYVVAAPHWATFMAKPLHDDLPIDEAQRLFCFGTPKFLISWLDHT
jgi:predicted acetyltransferase